MFTIVEGIVMRGSRGQLWAAYIDRNDVRYFTTELDYRNRVPLTIERWRERFADKNVVSGEAIERIPPFDF
jgi:hypothetical protein